MQEPDEEGDEDGGDAETDHGVPFPGEPVAPERRTDAWCTLPRGQPVDWRALFGREDAPRVVDLGCGNGRFLLGSALARPAHDHLGMDLVPQAVKHAARRAGERGLANLRYAWGDAMDLVFVGLAPGTIDELHVYHPQPYYDPRDAHRRMLSPAFFARAWAVLRPGTGRLVLQTDNPYYWDYVAHIAPRFFKWRNLQGPWPDAPAGRSRREIFARSRGLAIFRGEGTPRAINPRRVKTIARHLPPPRFDANRPKFRAHPRSDDSA